MTVRELIAILETKDPDAKVMYPEDWRHDEGDRVEAHDVWDGHVTYGIALPSGGTTYQTVDLR